MLCYESNGVPALIDPYVCFIIFLLDNLSFAAFKVKCLLFGALSLLHFYLDSLYERFHKHNEVVLSEIGIVSSDKGR